VSNSIFETAREREIFLKTVRATLEELIERAEAENEFGVAGWLALWLRDNS
jgi:hypothetical protein